MIPDSAEAQSPPSKFVRQLRLASVIISLVVIGLGVSVILGWLFDLATLKSIIPNRVTMTIGTALSLVLGGTSLLLWHLRQKNSLIISVGLYLLPSIAIAFSLISLIEFGFNLDLGTDLLSFPDSANVLDTAIDSRMSPNTAVSFFGLNTAILLLVGRYYLTAQLLIVLVAAIAIAALIGHIYDIAFFYSVDSATGMAVHTAVGLILLTFAFLAACSTKGWMRVVTRKEAGGLMARWLLPLVVIIPPMLGGIFWVLFKGNVYYLELIVASRIILEMLIFGSIVWWTARKLNHSDRQKQQFSQELLATERRFRAIFDQTFQFIGLLSPEGILLEANQTALDFGGISRADVVGKPFWSADWWKISPETQLKLRSAIATASTGEFVRYPVEVQGAGEIITIDFSLRPIKDEAGEVILLIPEGRDISEQIKAEKALQQSQARYQAIVEDQTELICRHGTDAKVSYVNEAFCRYFGMEKEQLINHQYTPVIYEPDRERVLQLVNSMNKNNPAITVENRVVTQGKVRWTQWNNRIIFDEAGFVEYQSVGRDITPLKEVEARLRESEERFRRAFEDAATGEALVAPDGRFIQVNQSLCEIVGYSEANLINLTFQEITHPDDLDLDMQYVQQMRAGDIRTYQMEKRYFHKLGHVVWVLLSVSMIKDAEAESMYFIAQIQDISQRKYAEAKLNALVKELERSNQELEEFASVVSHDLISPLRKQLMLIDLLQEEHGEALAAGEDYLTKIIAFNSRMENLVRSLLTYARVTTQAQPFVAVPLKEVIKDVLYDLELEIAKTKAQIEVQELPIVKGDRLQMRQLFLNLLQNALKFHAVNKIPQIKLSYQSIANWYQITVQDNGIGFEPEQQVKIFSPFHRLYSQSKYEGTGLGLAICNKIVQRHHGKITAESQLQQGTTFTIYLPE